MCKLLSFRKMNIYPIVMSSTARLIMRSALIFFLNREL